MRTSLIALLFALSFVCGCVTTKGEAPVNEGLAYFEVTFANDPELGSEESPLPQQEDYDFLVDIRAQGYGHGQLADYEGVVEIRLLTAKLISTARVDIVDGQALNVPVTMRYATHREAISAHEVVPWVSPTGTDTWRDTGKLGVSESIHLPRPTVAMIQGNHEENANYGFVSRFNNRNLTLADQELVVIAVLEGGFFVIDPTAPEYGSLYLYSYSTPYVDDFSPNATSTYHALEVGTIIEEVNGSVFEFFGFTEMSFPTYKPKRSPNGAILVDTDLIPPPADISELLDAGDDRAIEQWESSLVTVTDIIVYEFDRNDESFSEYYQFPLQRESSGAFIMATTLSTAPTFSPIDMMGEPVASMTGILKQHRASRPSTWTLVPRDINDIVVAD